MTQDNITAIYVDVDDFYRSIELNWQHYQKTLKARKRLREKILSNSEIMTIMILFHLCGYRCFKRFYLDYVNLTMTSLFPTLMSYSRMVIAMQCVTPLLCVYFKTRMATPTGISFIDSTSIKVCHNRRIATNKVFNGLAKRGKTTMGLVLRVQTAFNHQP